MKCRLIHEANVDPSATTILGVKVAFAAVSIGYVFFLCGYRLTDKKVAEVENELRSRRIDHEGHADNGAGSSG